MRCLFFLIKSINEKEKLKQLNKQHGSLKKECQEMFYSKEQPFAIQLFVLF